MSEKQIIYTVNQREKKVHCHSDCNIDSIIYFDGERSTSEDDEEIGTHFYFSTEVYVSCAELDEGLTWCSSGGGLQCFEHRWGERSHVNVHHEAAEDYRRQHSTLPSRCLIRRVE